MLSETITVCITVLIVVGAVLFMADRFITSKELDKALRHEMDALKADILKKTDLLFKNDENLLQHMKTIETASKMGAVGANGSLFDRVRELQAKQAI